MSEVYKEIPDHPRYKVSTLGNIIRKKDNHIIKQSTSNGYKRVYLDKKLYSVAVLMAITFLNHKPNGNTLVIDHKDGNRTKNILSNLQIISNRENVSISRKNNSGYTGVYYNKRTKRYRADIKVNNQPIYLGVYRQALEASEVYQKALTLINKYENLKQFKELIKNNYE